MNLTERSSNNDTHNTNDSYNDIVTIPTNIARWATSSILNPFKFLNSWIECKTVLTCSQMSWVCNRSIDCRMMEVAWLIFPYCISKGQNEIKREASTTWQAKKSPIHGTRISPNKYTDVLLTDCLLICQNFIFVSSLSPGVGPNIECHRIARVH